MKPDRVPISQLGKTSPGSASPQAAKANLRSLIQARLQQSSPRQKEAGARAACQLLLLQVWWQEARRVLLFAPLPDELDLWPVVGTALAAGKTVALPRFDAARREYAAAQVANLRTDVDRGCFGIREPCGHCCAQPLNQLDLVLVPGVVFDECGRRLGRGKGYYDRLLRHVGGLKCGVAFDEQVVPEVPQEPHDVVLDCILTPTRLVDVRPRAVLT